MKGHIAFFLADLRAGGAEKVMLSLAEEVSRRGYVVDLVVSSQKGELSNHLPKGVCLFDLGSSPASRSNLHFAWQTLLRLSRYLRSRRPDCLLSTLTGANLIAIVALSIAGKKSTSLVLREASSHYNIGSFMRRWLVQHLYPYADACIAVSQGVSEDLIDTFELPPEKVHTIHNPVDASSISALAMAPATHPWASHSPTPYVIAAGRLRPEKGFDYLIREFHSIRNHTDSNLLILGEGPERRNLEELVTEFALASRVNLPGYLENPFPLIAKARLFVLSSQWEGFPNVLLQALALGVPVVATDCHSGPAEILNNGEFGKLVPCGKQGGLAKAMLDALDKPAETSLLQSRAADYSLTIITDRYLELIREVCGDANRIDSPLVSHKNTRQ